jgi:adenine deaminase
MQPLKGNIVNIPAKTIQYGIVSFKHTTIEKIEIIAETENPNAPYILPGFIDSHIHIESSMLVPAEFAKLAVVHGTVATISDPHEIANVCGIAGVEFMIENGKTVPFKFCFGAPSCVPATSFETAGATVSVPEVETLLQNKDIYYLSEMMNFPGVLHNDPEVLAKINLAKKYNKPVDGHAPGLTGTNALTYINAGITTDHECTTYEEALFKLQNGMHILIREGSAAKNFDALIDLLHYYPQQIMFCSDDKHPDSLLVGHINQLCAKAIAHGIPVFNVLQAACINPIIHYKIPVGTLNINSPADCIVVDNLTNFNVLQTYINGELVAQNSTSLINTTKAKPINNFGITPISVSQLAIDIKDGIHLKPAIVALNGQLLTQQKAATPLLQNNFALANTQTDCLKIVVVNRYGNAPIAKGFIYNFGLQQGALASTVAHDSHNIIAVGCTDDDICAAINLVIKEQGGISAVTQNQQLVIGLPVAGLMSNNDGTTVANAYTQIDNFTKDVLGSTLTAPFMTLSFMALLVIPDLKLSDKGLFSGANFAFV